MHKTLGLKRIQRKPVFFSIECSHLKGIKDDFEKFVVFS